MFLIQGNESHYIENTDPDRFEAMIGQTVSHYTILEEHGRGGMAEVYLAGDTKLDRRVALKFLAPLGDEEAGRRFIHEAKIAASLNHPNICTIHEIDEAGSRNFIVMEHVEGESLKEMTPALPSFRGRALQHAAYQGPAGPGARPARRVREGEGLVRTADHGRPGARALPADTSALPLPAGAAVREDGTARSGGGALRALPRGMFRRAGGIDRDRHLM